jgi:hypothetical protein
MRSGGMLVRWKTAVAARRKAEVISRVVTS